MEESVLQEVKSKLDVWRKWNYYPCGTVFGPIAQEYGLSFVDASILSWIRYLSKGTQSHCITHNGVKYVWVHYQTTIDHNPMMGVANKRVLGRHLVNMEKLGILLRFDENKTDSSRSYFCVPDDVAYFLYATIEHGDDLARICKEWIQWKKTGELTPLPTIPKEVSHETPLSLFDTKIVTMPSLSKQFLEFIEKVKKVSNFKPNLYDKEGNPYKGMVELNKWYDALLQGTFATKFKPVNPDYDYTTIGPVSEEMILQAIQKAPAFIEKLPQLFMAFKSKRSILLDTIVHLKPTKATAPYIADDEKTAMKENKGFQNGLYWMKRMYSAFDMSNPVVMQLWELQKWYEARYYDLVEINTPGQFAFKIGKKGFDRMGEFLGSYAKSRGKPPTVQDLKLDSYWWQRFAVYMLKGHSCKILLDESVFRKESEKLDANERLYEERPYDYQGDANDFT